MILFWYSGIYLSFVGWNSIRKNKSINKSKIGLKYDSQYIDSLIDNLDRGYLSATLDEKELIESSFSEIEYIGYNADEQTNEYLKMKLFKYLEIEKPRLNKGYTLIMASEALGKLYDEDATYLFDKLKEKENQIKDKYIIQALGHAYDPAAIEILKEVKKTEVDAEIIIDATISLWRHKVVDLSEMMNLLLESSLSAEILKYRLYSIGEDAIVPLFEFFTKNPDSLITIFYDFLFSNTPSYRLIGRNLLELACESFSNGNDKIQKCSRLIIFKCISSWRNLEQIQEFVNKIKDSTNPSIRIKAIDFLRALMGLMEITKYGRLAIWAKNEITRMAEKDSDENVKETAKNKLYEWYNS